MKITFHAHMFAAVMLGMVSQIAQVLILRELLMVFHGNELSIGIILCAWLAWVGLGSWAGSKVVNRLERPTMLLGLSALGIFLSLPGTIFLVRVIRSFFSTPSGAYLSLEQMIISSFVLMGPVCLLLGAQFVFLSRIWREKDSSLDTSGAAKTYMSEAAGNMTGGLIFTLLMVHFLNSFQTALVISGLMLATAAFLHSRSLSVSVLKSKNLAFVLLCLMLASAPAFFLLQRLDERAWQIQWQYMTPEHELAGIYQSKHGNIAVVQRQDQFSFFQSGHLMFSTAGPETMVPGLEEQEAVVFAHLSMAQHPAPENVLLIGGGLRGVLAEIVKHPVKNVDYIELDPVLTRAAMTHAFSGTLEALDDPRVRLIHIDARLYVKQATTKNSEKYDMIIVDAPDPATAVLNRYYTREFFREAREILNPDGVFVSGLMSTPDLRGRAVANRNAAIYHTMSSVFERVLPIGDRYLFFFASADPDQLSADPYILQRRYEQRWIEAQGFSGLHYHVLLEKSQMRRVNWVVRNHGRSPLSHLEGPASTPVFPDPVLKQEKTEKLLPPVNTDYFINSDFKPIGYFYTLMFWDEITRLGQWYSLELLLKVKHWWVMPLIIFPVFVVLGLGIFTKKSHSRADIHFAIVFTAFTTGFSTMVLQIALLFSFQSIYGFIYETVGLIVAMFMVGLAMGAFMAQNLVKDRSNINILALVQLIMALTAGAMAFILPLVAGLKVLAMIFALFSGLTFTAGFINGVDFPLTTACYLGLGKGAERSAGHIYSAELMGACLGAAAASALVAPVMGILACCFLAALASAAAFVTLTVASRFGAAAG